MNKTVFLLLLLIALSLSDVVNLTSGKDNNEDPEEVPDFKTKFASKYLESDGSFGSKAQYRLAVYTENLAAIRAINSDPTKTYKAGVNDFTDLQQKEFEAAYFGLKLPAGKIFLEVNLPAVSFTPIDWTSKNTPVKNQGACGSCWAFAVLGAMEGMIKKAKGTTLDLSEQELVDCSGPYGNAGCNGGWLSTAYKYIKEKNINTEVKYPYMAATMACKNITGQYTIKSYNETNVNVKSCSDLVDKLTLGPVAVAVDASGWGSYKSGVFNGCGTGLNHGVVAVAGNNTEWKIKNSWGKNWGASGYMRISPGNSCNICKYPTSIIL